MPTAGLLTGTGGGVNKSLASHGGTHAGSATGGTAGGVASKGKGGSGSGRRMSSSVRRRSVAHDQAVQDGLVQEAPLDPELAAAKEAAEMAVKHRSNPLSFRGFHAYFSDSLDLFAQVVDLDTSPEEAWAAAQTAVKGAGLSLFQTLTVLSILRPDATVPAVDAWIEATMDSRFVDHTLNTFTLLDSLKDSDCLRPLVFILSPGADPMIPLQELAQQTGFARKLRCISLGQGQGNYARDQVLQGVDNGSWVILQNCHLAQSWMPTLESLVESLDPDRTDTAFRLWLTCLPPPAANPAIHGNASGNNSGNASENGSGNPGGHPSCLPVSILQNSVKMTCEAPVGVRANMLFTLGSYSDSGKGSASYEVASGHHPDQVRPLLDALAPFSPPCVL